MEIKSSGTSLICSKISLHFFSSSLLDASKGLKNLTLTVYPEVIRRGQSAQLHCNYEVYDVPLYSVKWYRGIFEFYRYTPFEHPAGKTFFFNTGIKVDVSFHQDFRSWNLHPPFCFPLPFSDLINERISNALKISDGNLVQHEFILQKCGNFVD